MSEMLVLGAQWMRGFDLPEAMMRPTKPIFKWKPGDYLEPGYLVKKMKFYAKREEAKKSALEREELERIQKVRPMTRTAR